MYSIYVSVVVKEIVVNVAAYLNIFFNPNGLLIYIIFLGLLKMFDSLSAFRNACTSAIKY